MVCKVSVKNHFDDRFISMTDFSKIIMIYPLHLYCLCLCNCINNIQKKTISKELIKAII